MLSTEVICAQTDTAQNKLTALTDINSKVLDGLQKQYSNLQSKIDKQSAKLLSKMQRKEDKLHAKLNAIDSNKAKELFNDDIKERYTDLKNNLNTATDKFKRFPFKVNFIINI